ncbi:hypothetical protein [Nocardia brasiliensis]|uniref:hypothetical protein n=1 Tax=Nocardia brasiliensis TaxID=37326 RepID=UPI003D8D04AB
MTRLLSAGVAGSADYLAQIPSARIIATWGAGSPSVDVVVSAASATASGVTDGIFASGGVTDRVGAPIGEVMLWVEHGRLSAIEYAWYADARPTSLPDPAQIEV